MPEPRRIDMHVHMVGNGVAGSGGWLRLSGWHRWLAGFMIKQLGFPAAVLQQDLESIYAQHLLQFVRTSSLDAVVLLAHERVHDPDGKGALGWRELCRLKRIANPLERDWQFKKALGFPEEVRTRVGELLRKLALPSR